MTILRILLDQSQKPNNLKFSPQFQFKRDLIFNKIINLWGR